MITSPSREQPPLARELSLAMSALLAVALSAVPFLGREAASGMVTQVGVVLIVVLSLIDLTSTRVPNAVVYPALVFVLLATALVDPGLADQACLGAAVNLGVMFVLALVGRGAMGMGDVKFAALSGSLLGWQGGLASLLLGFSFGGATALVLLLLRIKSLKDALPLTPFLGAGALASALLFGFVL